MQEKRRAASTALAVVLALGAAGCGSTDKAPEAAPVPPRPAGTGPLTKDVVRADVDGAVKAADVPPGDPDWARSMEATRPGCVVSYKGFGAKGAPADIAGYAAVRDELAKRSWRLVGKGPGHEERDGVVFTGQEVLKQRGWTIVVEYRTGVREGEAQISAMALDDACVEKPGLGLNPAG